MQAVRNNPSDFSCKLKQRWTQLKAGTLSDPLYPIKGLISLSVKTCSALEEMYKSNLQIDNNF